MFQRLLHKRFTPLAILLLLVALVVSLNMVMAQDATPVDPATGTATFGTIDANSTPVTYSFNSNAADVVTIRVIGLTTGSDPNITLFGPSRQQLAVNDNDAFMPFGTSSELTFRLQETGTHFVTVAGTPGDFIMTINFRPVVPISSIEFSTPITVTLPSTQLTHAFLFNTDPTVTTSLLIDVTASLTETQIEIRNATGGAVMTLHGGVNDICLTFVPGDELHEVIVVSTETATGSMTLTLSQAPCELGDVAEQVIPQPTAQFNPVPIEGVCAASSPRNVNIRSGPSTAFPVVALLPAFQPMQVVGQNENGTWLAVQGNLVQGWISTSVIAVVGPCTGLPVVPVQPTPAASPTPGLPNVTVVTATPSVTGTTEATSEVTPEVTPETSPEVTEDTSPTAEGSTTPTETATATATP
jgi:uncharacterized protein YraI